MDDFVLVGACILFNVVCFVAGIYFGRHSEQKAVAKVLGEFRKVDDAAHSAVNRLYVALPYLKKFL